MQSVKKSVAVSNTEPQQQREQLSLPLLVGLLPSHHVRLARTSVRAQFQAHLSIISPEQLSSELPAAGNATVDELRPPVQCRDHGWWQVQQSPP